MNKIIVEIKNLIHDFVDRNENNEIIKQKRAVDDVSMEIKKGDFIAILGHNGSGKSTLAKHINAILISTSGTVFVNGKDTKSAADLWSIRQSAGMVFQNPDNQIIGTIVEDDIGFGPENLGVPTEDIWKRVENALLATGMTAYRKNSPSRLSGGQKQRVAIAGILAMKPDCIVLDEPTAMLDPQGRKEVLETLFELNKKEQVTIILITHHMDEVIRADKVFVMNQGKILLQGTPKEIFSHYQELKAVGLEVPQVTEIAHQLKEKGVEISDDMITVQEMTDAVKKLVRDCKKQAVQQFSSQDTDEKEQDLSEEKRNQSVEQKEEKQEPILSVQGLSYTYSPNSVYKRDALYDIDLDIYAGEYIGIVGKTGSGKSTLIQHLNGLNKAIFGQILYHGKDIYAPNFSRSELCKKVGLVFQYPEYQLFETTVLKDVCFGPKNMGLSEEECVKRAKEALRLTGISEQEEEMSPFELSGGQKRRVAIAGILAMQPEVLILDEPAAALDPKGRDEIFSLIKDLQKKKNMTIILVSHSMEDIANHVERMIVMNKGKKVMDDTPLNVFRHCEELEAMGLAIPQAAYLCNALRKEGIAIRENILTVDEAVEEILKVI